MMAAELALACPTERPNELVAVRWRTAYSYSWVHGALVDPNHPYSGPRKTLCGKRIYECSRVDGGAEAVDCGSCLRIIKRRS